MLFLSVRVKFLEVASGWAGFLQAGLRRGSLRNLVLQVLPVFIATFSIVPVFNCTRRGHCDDAKWRSHPGGTASYTSIRIYAE